MLKKIGNTFYILSFSLFIFLIISYYFSDENKRRANINRSTKVSEFEISNLPLLKNDTKNIIVFSDDVDVYKKKKKRYKFWDLISK
tara:strand:+ start:386 stop:643 length:258 start_codon:yes stop_codon:yes gene_type:complete